MGSETISKIPFIDFSDLKEESQTWESTKIQVRKAFEEYGCFEAKFDQIPLHLRKSLFDKTRQLFDLPLQNKQRNVSDKPYHGYVANPNVPLFESMGIDDILSPGKVETFAHLIWSEPNPTFSETVKSFSEQLSELDKIVRRMVLESLGLEKYIDEHINSAKYVVRLQKYSAPQSRETKVGLSSHTDINIVTILYQNEVNGLEVMSKDGDWITVEPSLDSFVVMIGESFNAWTNGRVHPPHHKVMMTGEDDRYSIGLFSAPKSGYITKAPDEMVDEEHPLLFKPYDHDEFLKFYYSESGWTFPSALRAYCGV